VQAFSQAPLPWGQSLAGDSTATRLGAPRAGPSARRADEAHCSFLPTQRRHRGLYSATISHIGACVGLPQAMNCTFSLRDLLFRLYRMSCPLRTTLYRHDEIRGPVAKAPVGAVPPPREYPASDWPDVPLIGRCSGSRLPPTRYPLLDDYRSLFASDIGPPPSLPFRLADLASSNAYALRRPFFWNSKCRFCSLSSRPVPARSDSPFRCSIFGLMRARLGVFFIAVGRRVVKSKGFFDLLPSTLRSTVPSPFNTLIPYRRNASASDSEELLLSSCRLCQLGNGPFFRFFGLIGPGLAVISLSLRG